MEIKQLQEQIHKNAVEKGFWIEDEVLNSDKICKKLMLVVSELTEAMEADRKGKYCKVKIEDQLNSDDFNDTFLLNVKDTFEDELADATIRILDLCHKMNINLEYHMIAKHRYNKTRPYLHGKKY